MEVQHHTRNIRIAPRKLRLVTDKIRHQKALDALGMLPLVTKRGALSIQKSLKAAVEAAKDQNLSADTLVIQRIWADEGPALKRTHTFSRGRMASMMKKYSHLTIVLKGEEVVSAPKRSKKEKAAPDEAPEEVVEEGN